MAQVPETSESYTGDGVNRLFTFTFPYLHANEVFVSVDGVNVTYVLTSPGVVETTVAPANGSAVLVYRNTAAFTPLYEFASGIPLRAAYIDANNTQLLYAVQEAVNSTAGTASEALAVANEALEVAQEASDKVDAAVIDSALQLRLDLANTADPAKGSALVGYKSPLANAVARTIYEKSAETVSVADFGAKGDGVTDDTNAIQTAINEAGKGGVLIFPKTAVNVYRTTAALKYLAGQTWLGSGGADVAVSGTIIKLTAASTSVAEPATGTSAITYGFNPKGIFFWAQTFAPAALWLLNTSYAMVDQCAFINDTDNGTGLLLDGGSTGPQQTYFNVVTAPRALARGLNGAAVKLRNGANSNQFLGGKLGGTNTKYGMRLESLSQGNVIIGTNFETITTSCVYADAPDNTFLGARFEDAPVGFDITANGANTNRVGCSYATATVVNVQGPTGARTTVLDTRNEASGVKGDLAFGGAKFDTAFFSGSTTLNYNPTLNTASSQAILNLFNNTNTSGVRQFNIFKGNGTATVKFSVNADTGQIQCDDISQGDTNGVFRRQVRRSAAPTTGSWATGDIAYNTAPVAGGFIGWVCTAGGTPGTWKTFGAISP